MEFVRRHDLDGFDIDWEYPGLRGNDNVHRPEDKQNFTAMMGELRQALDPKAAAAPPLPPDLRRGRFIGFPRRTPRWTRSRLPWTS